MNRYIANTLGLTAIAALACIGWAAFSFGRLANDNRAQIQAGIKQANDTVHDIRAESHAVTIAMVDKGRPGKPETMGLIPAVKFMAEDGGATLKVIQHQAGQTSTLVSAAATSIQDVATHVNSTADAATGTLQQATGTLGTAQTTIASLSEPINRADGAIAHFDALLVDPHIPETLAHVDATTAHIDASTGDFQLRFHDLLFPPPCPNWRCKLSRHVWPILRDGAQLGYTGYWTKQLILDVPPGGH